MLRLEPLLAQPVRQLSLGQRMRAEFAAALLHDPQILFLDEPTIGLDAPSKLAVRDFVRRLNREQGVTVLLTTHDMHDVEALAERVIVIGQGRLLADRPFASLRTGVLAERRLHIDFAGPAPEIDMPGVTVRGATNARSSWPSIRRTSRRRKLIAAIATQHAVEDIHVDEVADRGGDRPLLRPARRARGMTMLAAAPLPRRLPRALPAHAAVPRRGAGGLCDAAAGGAASGSWCSPRSTAPMRRRRRSAWPTPITYVWLGQALLALLPWLADPEIGQAVRTGGVGYDRLRPLDAYGYWYARTLGWMLARVAAARRADGCWPPASCCRWSGSRPGPGGRRPALAAALLFVAAFALMIALAAADRDAGEHRRGREPQRARRERHPGSRW